MNDHLLTLPPGAYVVARPDGLAIITIQALGPVAALNDLRAVPMPMPGQVVEAERERPALAEEATKPARKLADYQDKPRTPPVVCPECGGFFHRKGIAIHRSKAHGVPRQALHKVRPDQPEVALAAEAPVEQASNTVVDNPPPVNEEAAAVSTATPAAVDHNDRGTCPTCGAPEARHLRCDECGRLIGNGHAVLMPARMHHGKAICRDCDVLLKRAEVRAGRPLVPMRGEL